MRSQSPPSTRSFHGPDWLAFLLVIAVSVLGVAVMLPPCAEGFAGSRPAEVAAGADVAARYLVDVPGRPDVRSRSQKVVPVVGHSSRPSMPFVRSWAWSTRRRWRRGARAGPSEAGRTHR